MVIWLDDVSQNLGQIWTPTRFLKALAITREPKSNFTKKNQENMNLGPLYTQDWEPVTTTPQALSLVDKAEPVKFASQYAWAPTVYVNVRWM